MMNQSSRPKVVDIFCGAGGMSLGFEQAGFDIVVAVDHDSIHSQTHQQNFPACQTLTRDISELTGAEICEAADINGEDVDVVIGGPPCQGFSIGGKRRKDDPRNLLIFEFARILEELQPQYWVMENVEGLLNGASRIIMVSFLDRLKKSGYAIAEPIQTLDSRNYGVPQRRKRVFILGYKPTLTALSYPEPGPDTHIKTVISCPTVWEAISDLCPLDNHPELFFEDIYRGELGIGSEYSKILRGTIDDHDNHSISRNSNSNALTGCRRSLHTKETIRRFSETKPGTYEPISRLYRLKKEGVSNVLRAGTGKTHGSYTAPRPIHPVTPRCITVREAARLQSFPDWFQFDSTIWHGFRQVGNSVPPFLARTVGASVMKAVDESTDGSLSKGRIV